MKIVIIGAGAAGLMAAWLLEETHEVIVLEAENHLGGHAETAYLTVDGQEVAMELGFEFFSKPLFPNLNKLLHILSVPVQAYPLSYTFYGPSLAPITLPPFYDGRYILSRFSPRCLSTMLQFSYLLMQGKQFLKKGNHEITLQEFADSLWLTKRFKEQFLYPFYAGAWGAPIENMKQYSADNILTWSIVNKPAGLTPGIWLEVVGGISQYIKALAQDFRHTRIITNNKVESLRRDSHTYTITTHTGAVFTADHVICATNASVAKHIVKDLPNAQSQLQALNLITYFPTTIMIHGDPRYMPEKQKHWATANIYYNGETAALTIHKPWHYPFIFRSWIMHTNEPPPEPLYSTKKYFHANVNYEYFKAQSELSLLQGKDNLWFIGIYTYGIDSHDSSLASALEVAKKIAPDSSRLNLFLSH